MSNPHLATPQEARKRILEAPESITVKLKDYQATIENNRQLFMSVYAFGCRVKELVGYVSPSERRPEINYGVKNNEIKYAEFAGEEFALFELNTLKRKTLLTRKIALPVKAEYEPFTHEIIKAYEKADDLVFPVSRQVAYVASLKIFKGLQYWIDPYMKENKATKKMEIVPGHLKRYAVHANRHTRSQELGDFFRFNKDELQTFHQWSARFVNVSPQLERYLKSKWEDYAPKLLKKNVFNP